ncbi:MAG: orotidine-5'-phosphate decarboxylase [Candidatus Vogelbacteria bacterium]|nr:orotidine-5'-phosphate decarboxylase [Candidatus Vogelbacteria bacterium]
MSDRNFKQMLETQWSRGNFVCVGLDSEFDKIPECVRVGGNGDELLDVEFTVSKFNERIVDATHDLVCAYKPQSAFYEALGDEGWRALRETIAYIHEVAPDVPVILDAKRNDIGNTSEQYARAVFDWLEVDAVTVNPYLGGEALQPFLARAEKGVIVLCRTSNPGAGELQDLAVLDMPLYQYVAARVAGGWNKNGNCALVVGATYPDELREVRGLVGDMPILIPGIGAQGGDVEKTVAAGKDSRGQGMIINSSRGIIFASKGADFAEAARRETEKLHDLINQYRFLARKRN